MFITFQKEHDILSPVRLQVFADVRECQYLYSFHAPVCHLNLKNIFIFMRIG